MKQLIFLLVLTLIVGIGLQAQGVGVGTSSPHASAQLDLNSTNKGILIPRMSSAQRGAIASPAKGLLVFDNDLNGFWYFNGTGWVTMNSAAPAPGSFTLPIDTTVNMTARPFSIYNENTVSTQPVISGSSYAGVGISGTSTNLTGVMGTSQSGYGVSGFSSGNPGVLGTNNGGGIGVKGVAASTSSLAIGVRGETTNGFGVSGEASGGTGVRGSGGENGVFGSSSTNTGCGVKGWNGASGIGVRAEANLGYGIHASSSNSGIAGRFTNNGFGKALLVEGGVQITGGNTSPGAGKVLTSDADGNATWQMTPSAKKIAFKLNEAFPSGANVFAAGPKYKVYFANEEYDYGNNVTPGDQSTNSVFTAPITGIYHFDAAIEWNVPGIETQIHLFKITTGGSEVVIRTVAVNGTL